MNILGNMLTCNASHTCSISKAESLAKSNNAPMANRGIIRIDMECVFTSQAAEGKLNS